ncbi:hypothetical protein L596_024969 [Steinernema carpocapsae]|uniref:Uncharacterized protein n=1 Tax=Steinernema carpocapsae TaxID=34508 RepID=A0A4U5M6E1_STECR|nr:hypothetical protein L596_024969 [Steinernema carpocapsae]
MFSCFRTPRHHPALISLPYCEQSCGKCHENTFNPVTLIEVTPQTPIARRRNEEMNGSVAVEVTQNGEFWTSKG